MKRTYDKREDIPKGLESYYEESAGKFTLKPIEGLKPAEEFVQLQSDIATLKSEKAEIEKKFKPFEKMDLKEVQSKLDKFEIYEKKKAGGEETNAEALQIKVAELQRENERLTTEHKTAFENLTALQKEKVNAIMKDKIRALAFNKEKQQFIVNESSLPAIEKIFAIDLEYNETAKNFFTKDDKKVPIEQYFQDKAKEYGFFKGSTGDGDAGSGSAYKAGSKEETDPKKISVYDAVAKSFGL